MKYRLYAALREAVELVMLAMLQNLSLVFAVFSERPSCKRMAALSSGFLVLFSVGISTQSLTLIAAGAYGICGLWWMSLQYWRRLQGTHVAAKVEHCWPTRAAVLVLFSGFIAAVSIGLLGQFPSSTYVLNGIMPTSEGSRSSEEFARAGVRGGAAMVAAKELPQSFGPVQSDLMLESEMPSLYDMFNELYGEPFKTRKQEKVVVLPTKDVIQNHHSRRVFPPYRLRRFPPSPSTLPSPIYLNLRDERGHAAAVHLCDLFADALENSRTTGAPAWRCLNKRLSWPSSKVNLVRRNSSERATVPLSMAA